MPKTGSSSIQAALEAQRAALRREGVVYPAAFGARGAQYRLLMRAVQAMGPGALEAAFPRGYRGIATASLDPWDAFERRFDAETAGARTVVMSCEGLWGAILRPARRDALARFMARFDDVTVVAYLRRQDAQLLSAWVQMIKGTPALTRTSDDLMDNPATRALHAYHDRLADWRAAMPDARIVVRPFERGQLEGGDVVADFATHAGLPLDPALPATRANPSLDGPSASFLHRLNGLLPPADGTPARARARAVLRRAAVTATASRADDGLPPAPRLSLGRDRARAYLDRFAGQNAAVAREYLGRADGVLFAEPVGGPHGPVPDALAASADPLAEALRLSARVVGEAEREIARLRERIEALSAGRNGSTYSATGANGAEPARDDATGPATRAAPLSTPQPETAPTREGDAP